MRRLDYQEVSVDILTGMPTFGTGGGGLRFRAGLGAVEKEFGREKEFKLGWEFPEIQDEAQLY